MAADDNEVGVGGRARVWPVGGTDEAAVNEVREQQKDEAWQWHLI